jgi:hypothetical protein
MLIAALLAVAGLSGAAHAGWVTIQNDTNRVVVIQGSVTCEGHVRRCKPVRLLPGESLREYHSNPSLTVEVFDGRNPSTSLGTSTLTIKSEKQAFTVGNEGPTIRVTPLPRR